LASFVEASFEKVRIGYRIYSSVRLYFQEFSCTLQNSDKIEKTIKLSKTDILHTRNHFHNCKIVFALSKMVNCVEIDKKECTLNLISLNTLKYFQTL